MSTVRDLITDSLKDLGAIGIDETPTDSESADALRALNQLIGTWRIESLMVYSMNQQVFNLPSVGTPYYTIGPGGDFDTDRPTKIEAAYNRQPEQNDLEIYIAKDFTDYSNIISKLASSSIITALYYDPSYPLGKVYVWPVFSTSSVQLVLWTWGVLNEYASIDSDVALPPGYERMMRTNLAVELAPRYGKTISPALALFATESKEKIKTNNVTLPTMGFDNALGGGGIAWNWISGQPT